MERTDVMVGDHIWLTLPYSEVCMFMGVAGKRMCVIINPDGAQLLTPTGSAFSGPITHGEAGIHRDADGSLYTYNHKGE